MPKVMNINIAIELPSDEWEEAAHKVALRPVVNECLKSLNEAGIVFTSVMSTGETRAKTAPTGAKRGRKPKAPPPPVIVTAGPDEDEAA